MGCNSMWGIWWGLWSLVNGLDWKAGKLNNGMKYTLLHDEGLTMARVSLRVGAGHSMSPQETPALAYIVATTLSCSHAAEKEETFEEFLKKVDGSSWTTLKADVVYFQFQVPKGELNRALLRLNMVLVDRAVGRSCINEAIFQLQDKLASGYDMHPAEKALREYGTAGHPLTRSFMQGAEWVGINYMLNGENILIQAKEFFNNFYHAKNMHMVVESSELPEKLLRQISRFIKIPSGEDIAPVIPPYLYADSDVPARIVRVAPEAAQIRLIQFELPRVGDFSEFLAYGYFDYMMWSVHEGSFVKFLKANSYGLLTGIDVSLLGTSVVTGRLSLSNRGYDHIDEIMGGLFTYLKKIDDMDDHHIIQFNKISKIRQALAPALPWVLPVQMALYKDDMHQFLIGITPDLDSIKGVLKLFSKERFVMVSVSKRFTNSTIQKLTHSEIHSWSAPQMFSLPLKNPFLLSHPHDPSRIIETTILTKSKQIQSYIIASQNNLNGMHVILRAPIFNARFAICMELLSIMIDFNLTSLGMNILDAGIFWDISTLPDGLHIHLSGYGGNFITLVPALISTIKSPPKDFQLFKAHLMRKLSNRQPPEPLASLLLHETIREGRYPDKLKTLAKISISEFTNLIANFVSLARLNIVGVGDISAEDILHVESKFKELTTTFFDPKLPSPVKNPTHLHLNQSAYYERQVPTYEENRSAVAIYIGSHEVSRTNSLCFWIMVQLMKRWELWDYAFPSPIKWQLDPFTLGYHVGLELVVSGHIVPKLAEIKAMEGINKFYNYVRASSKAVLQYEISTLLSCTNISEHDFIDTLVTGYNDFHKCETNSATLQLITPPIFLNFLSNFTLPTSPTFQKLSIRIIPKPNRPQRPFENIDLDHFPQKFHLTNTYIQVPDLDMVLLENKDKFNYIEPFLGYPIKDLDQWKNDMELAERPKDLNPLYPF